jgi:hypothetical protein
MLPTLLNDRVADPCQKPVVRFGKQLTHVECRLPWSSTEGSFDSPTAAPQVPWL